MTGPTSKPQPDANINDANDSPLIAKLKKQKSEKTGDHTMQLPETGVSVTWPKFQSHGAWMKAQRLAKKDPAKASNYYLTGVCRFDGEKMTVTDFVELIPSGDIFALMESVMGDLMGGDVSDEGNALH